jgi:Ni2+-binding GTPase involved in maturation of urease and hydrogenase
MPVVDGDRLLAMWVASDGGGAHRVDADRVYQATPDADALDAVGSLIEGSEAVLVWDGGRPVGILTRADVLELVRRGLAGDLRGIAVPPVVVRLVGPAGSGKTTLIARTVPLLRRCEVGVIQANPPGAAAVPELAGIPVISDPHAHWRKGLRAAVERLAGVGLILVEDRDSRPHLEAGLGEDAQVLVVPACDLDGLDDATLRQAQAVVATKVEDVPEGVDVEAALASVAQRHPQLATFAVPAAEDGEGLAAWHAWIEALALRRHR